MCIVGEGLGLGDVVVHDEEIAFMHIRKFVNTQNEHTLTMCSLIIGTYSIAYTHSSSDIPLYTCSHHPSTVINH